MKNLKFRTDEFIPQLSSASSVVNSKSALPILGDVRIESKGNNIVELMTSDGESWLQMTANCIEVDNDVCFCVEAKAFLSALRNLQGADVQITIDTDKMVLACKYSNGRFTMPIEDATEFPTPMESPQDTKNKRVDSRKLLTAIEKAAFATANDELRPVMNGVHFDFFADGMVAVASDGHKLAKFKDLTVTHNGTDPTVYGFTLPKKPSHLLLNILASTIAGDVTVSFTDNCAIISNELFRLTARLIDMRYPNYDSVIPKTNDKHVTIDKGMFLAALKRVLPMGNQSSQLVRLDFADGQMTIAAEDFDFSKSAQESVPCDFALAPFTIGFKGTTLLQLLQNIDTASVMLSMTDPSRAGVLTEDKPNTAYEYTSLIMPMVIQ